VKIVAKYEDLNPAWLLTGKGNILLEASGNSATIGNERKPTESRLDEIEKQLKALEMKWNSSHEGKTLNDGKKK
jgi:hypothetical protein